MGRSSGPAAPSDIRRSWQQSATVALDIGAGHGALVIYPADRYRGREIEISRDDVDGPRVHTGVHERMTGNGPVLTAIFGSLPTGDYVVWADAGTVGPTVSVPDGAVAELRLLTARLPDRTPPG